MSTSSQTDLKILATGLGAGILVDAVVVRCLLVPGDGGAVRPGELVAALAAGAGAAGSAFRGGTSDRGRDRDRGRPGRRPAVATYADCAFGLVLTGPNAQLACRIAGGTRETTVRYR